MLAALSTGTEVWVLGLSACPLSTPQHTTHTAGESHNKEQDKEQSQKIILSIMYSQAACRLNLNDTSISSSQKYTDS